MANAAVKFTDSTFKIKNKPEWRGDPSKDFQHRLKTKEHLEFLHVSKLIDVRDSRWAQATVKGEVVYGHMYEGCEFIIRLSTKNGELNLTHNQDGTLDRHLMDNPGEAVVWSITSLNNGLESTHTFSALAAGLSSVFIVCVGLAASVALAQGLAAAEAEEFVASAIGAMIGAELDVAIPVVGIVLAVLAFIGIWIVYEIGREIVLNLIYENRSATKSITLVDHYVYNIGDTKDPLPAKLQPLSSLPPFEFYYDVVVNIDNYSKFSGVGVSLKFQKDDGSFLIICVRNDIYKDAHYTIKAFAKDDKTSPKDVYDNCDGPLVTQDFPWGDLVVKNALDATGFNQYKFAGILSFNDAK
jgi:hypothetical protein